LVIKSLVKYRKCLHDSFQIPKKYSGIRTGKERSLTIEKQGVQLGAVIRRSLAVCLAVAVSLVGLSPNSANAGTTGAGGVTVIVDKFQTRYVQLDGTTTIPFKRIHGTVFNLNSFDIQIDSVTLNYYSGSTLLGSVVNVDRYINWIYGTDFVPNASRIPAMSQTSLGLYPSVSSSIWQNATDVKVSLSWHQISYDENRNFEFTVVSSNTSSESRGGTTTTYQTHVVRVKNLNSGAARQPEIVGIYRASSDYYGLFSAIEYFDTFHYFKNLGGWTDTEHLMAPGETRELVLKRQVGLDEPEIPTNITFIAESITPLATANPVLLKPTTPSVTDNTPAATAAPAIKPAVKLPAMKLKQKLSGQTLAKQISMNVPLKAVVKLNVAKSSKSICKVDAGKLVALKKGKCSVTVTVTPAKTKTVKKPKAIKKSTVVAIS